jgi:hypothetical protein
MVIFNSENFDNVRIANIILNVATSLILSLVGNFKLNERVINFSVQPGTNGEKDFEDVVISYSTKEESQINSELSTSVSSKFPYGYSDNYLKHAYNHLKEISCKSQPYFKFSWVELTCKLTNTDFGITSIKSDSYYNSEKLLSILKDNYDGPNDTILDESKLLLNVF